MSKSHLPEFDVLVDMAENAPERLEALRRSMVQHVIESADTTHRHRLEGLQSQIDMIRRGSPNPLAACIRISQMMCESLADMRRALSREEHYVVQTENDSAADIIPFPRRER